MLIDQTFGQNSDENFRIDSIHLSPHVRKVGKRFQKSPWYPNFMNVSVTLD